MKVVPEITAYPFVLETNEFPRGKPRGINK